MTIEASALWHVALFLGIPSVFLVFFAQWRWAKQCDNNIQVLIAYSGGGGSYKLSPKLGNVVTIEDPDTKEVRTWPINELSTIDVPYPGLGFLPKWMQKTIRLAIVNEGDMEPLLNRSPHRKQIASPDVVAVLKSLIATLPQNDTSRSSLEAFVSGISSGPTRELVGDPLTLGTLRKNTVLQALANVSNDLVDVLESIRQRLYNLVTLNPNVIYIGIGLAIIAGIVSVFFIKSQGGQLTSMQGDLNSIKSALGIVTTTTGVVP